MPPVPIELAAEWASRYEPFGVEKYLLYLPQIEPPSTVVQPAALSPCQRRCSSSWCLKVYYFHNIAIVNVFKTVLISWIHWVVSQLHAQVEQEFLPSVLTINMWLHFVDTWSETISLYSYVEFIIHALYAVNMLDIIWVIMVCTVKHCTFLTDCVVDFVCRRRFECRNRNLKKTLCLTMEFCCAELQFFFNIF